MRGFGVTSIEPLTLDRGEPTKNMFALSPFVWEEGGGFSMMLRLVPDEPDPTLKIARIHYGRSRDGLHFLLDDEPAIEPGPGEEDDHGCEDPTVVFIGDRYHVFYTGWNQVKKEGELLHASGPNVWALAKQGLALGEEAGHNPKEATIILMPEGDCRLFYEFAEAGVSRIGVAVADSVEGPWTPLEPLCAARPGEWDGHHVSTGPVWRQKNGPPVMFYNGANQFAHWRIGWLTLDETLTKIIERSRAPLISPPIPQGDATDIAFSASCVEQDDVLWLYYSIADKELRRAELRPA